MKYDDLEKLNSLREKGAITEEEYQREKEKILNGSPSLKVNDLLGMDINTYCTLLHLSQFLGVVLPILGYAAPIVLWMLNREKYPLVNRHGIVVVNWIITALILYAVSFILTFIFIGIPMLILLFLINGAFIIMGAIKANTGTVWRYPFSFDFIKEL